MVREEICLYLENAQANSSNPETAIESINPEEICEILLDNCLAPDTLMGTGCDNMTLIIVFLLHGKPQSDLVLRCQRPGPPKPVPMCNDDGDAGDNDET